MCSCVWRIAREQYPDATITAVIRPHLKELLEGVGEIDEILEVDTKNVFSAARALKQPTKPDAILLLPNSVRSALIARLAGIPIRVGYQRTGRSWLLTHAVPIERQNEPTPTAQYYLHLANEAFGTTDENAMPTIGISNQQIAEGSTLLSGLKQPVVLLVVGASKERKRWPVNRFAEVADRLSKCGAQCCIIGSPQETSIALGVVDAATQPITDLTGSDMSLGSLKAVVQQADLMITNDTGPRHIAVATGTPVITLYGPTDFRWTWYDCEQDIPVLADPFLPQSQIADQHEQRCSIDKISVGDVVAHAKKLLAI